MTPKQHEIDRELDKNVHDALKHLNRIDATSPEYATLTDQIKKLHAMRHENKRKTVDPNTLFLGAVNILGIAMITRYEKANVVTSKALGFILKPR